MVRSPNAWAFAGLVLVSVVSGCMSPRPFHEGPDLNPVKPLSFSGPDGFCDLFGDRESSQLRVYVQNIGDDESPAAITSIEFFPGGSVQLHTPALPAGESIDRMPVAISGLFRSRL